MLFASSFRDVLNRGAGPSSGLVRVGVLMLAVSLIGCENDIGCTGDQGRPAPEKAPANSDTDSSPDSLADLSPVELGEKLYSQQGCRSCHSLDGSKKGGPSFKGLYGTTDHEMEDGTTLTVDEAYLRESITEPGAKIVAGYQNLQPNTYKSLSDRELAGLVAFIKARSEKPPPEE